MTAAPCRWPRSDSSPSLTSHIADAPAIAARGPSSYGGCGRRWASTTTRGDRNPRASTAYPASAQPSRPAYATSSPGRAPERSTGGRPSRVPSAVTETTIRSPCTVSPPTRLTPSGSPSSASPRARSSAQAVGRSGGAASPTTIEVGRAPIAAMSARFCAAALRPTSYPSDQSRRKCRPSTIRSVVTTIRPSGTATTAASSPGPTRTSSPCFRPAVTSSMRPNSPVLASVSATPRHYPGPAGVWTVTCTGYRDPPRSTP
jgi:hypothetical protein